MAIAIGGAGQTGAIAIGSSNHDLCSKDFWPPASVRLPKRCLCVQNKPEHQDIDALEKSWTTEIWLLRGRIRCRILDQMLYVRSDWISDRIMDRMKWLSGQRDKTEMFFEWICESVHYWLRRPMGFSGVQKVDKTQSQKTPLSKSKCIFDQNISQIFHQWIFIIFLEN